MIKPKKSLKSLETPFEVADALRGNVTGDYMADLKRLVKNGKMCSAALYDLAYQLHSQP